MTERTRERRSPGWGQGRGKVFASGRPVGLDRGADLGRGCRRPAVTSNDTTAGQPPSKANSGSIVPIFPILRGASILQPMTTGVTLSEQLELTGAREVTPAAAGLRHPPIADNRRTRRPPAVRRKNRPDKGLFDSRALRIGAASNPSDASARPSVCVKKVGGECGWPGRPCSGRPGAVRHKMLLSRFQVLTSVVLSSGIQRGILLLRNPASSERTGWATHGFLFFRSFGASNREAFQGSACVGSCDP
jgi:hypothetical protein